MTEPTQAPNMIGTSALRRVVSACFLLGLAMPVLCPGGVDSGFGDSAGFVLNTQDDASVPGGGNASGYGDSAGFVLNTRDDASVPGGGNASGYGDSAGFVLNTQDDASAPGGGNSSG